MPKIYNDKILHFIPVLVGSLLPESNMLVSKHIVEILTTWLHLFKFIFYASDTKFDLVKLCCMLVLHNLQPLHCSTCILNASPYGILYFVYLYIFNILNNYCLLVLIHAGKHCEPEN